MQNRQSQSSRRSLLPSMLAGAIAFVAISSLLCSGSRGVEVADLQDRLEKDLRALTPAQFSFIARVVQAVEDDVLPLAIVDSTYLWARKKPRNCFQYFEKAIRVRAQRLGIEI